MGVPKFYKWISERYPCLSEVVKEYQIPDFDNLYLDMNGIIHICSHPNDNDPHFRMTEEKMFKDIFHYIEVLFRLVQPKQVFFMAVDGVAPRAKMNQQRGRRFRSAREAIENEKKARDRGEVLPSEERFDSNCITPGTEFMVRLDDQLQYFVTSKISQDKMWQNCKVIYSGHETPGEGEHKIMEYIRYTKSQPGYNPNTRHCLYGLDADLMMLGLTSHEPHFSLLREEVRFGGKKDNSRTPLPEETTFHLLHLSLMREYINYEFESLQTALPFKYNLENVIDDWVLMGFLVGNDFIPHLPNLHINKGALPLLYSTYKEVLPTMDGYLNMGGKLHLGRFEKFMKKLAEFDVDYFSGTNADLKYFNSKRDGNGFIGKRMKENLEPFFGEGEGEDDALGVLEGEDLTNDDIRRKFEKLGLQHDQMFDDDDDSDSEESTLDMEFRQHKTMYYYTKMNVENTAEALREQAEGYVTGIQWILNYYYNGICSWSWYYPHHYSPYISDIKGFADMELKFELGKPFKPFEQLLAVLPPLSVKLLPKAYHGLMLNENSPLKKFYPETFQTDLNGKVQDWEAVVLIPFIDEELLLEAMASCNERLTPRESARNSHGPMYICTYTSDNLGECRAPNYFPPVGVNHNRVQLVYREEWMLPPEQIYKGLCKNFKQDIYFMGFPSLKHISHTFHVEKAGVRVFNQASREDSYILDITHPPEIPSIKDVADQLLGKVVFVSWPHLIEAMVEAVSDGENRYSIVKSGERMMTEEVQNQFTLSRSTIAATYKERWGIKIGATHVLVYAKPMTGRKYIQSSSGQMTLEKEWSEILQPYAYQAIVKDLKVHDQGYEKYLTPQEYFPPRSKVFMLGQPHYGCIGEVIEIDPAHKGRIRVAMTVATEPNLEVVKQKEYQYVEKYMSGSQAAQRTGVNPQLLARITGTVFLAPPAGDNPMAEMETKNKLNIGLNLKNNRRNEEVIGYTRKIQEPDERPIWQYSLKVVEVIKEYQEKFPEIFFYMSTNAVQRDIFYQNEVFPNNYKERVTELTTWLKSADFAKAERQPCGTQSLGEALTGLIIEEVDKVAAIRAKAVKMQVRPHLLFKPNPHQGSMPPDKSVKYMMFDRVVNVREGYSVPLGARGTIVGIQPAVKDEDVMYDILFDEAFNGGLTLRGPASAQRCYRLHWAAMINISHGSRLTNPQLPVENKWNQSPQSVWNQVGRPSGQFYQNSRQMNQNNHFYKEKRHQDRDGNVQHNFQHQDRMGNGQQTFQHQDRIGNGQQIHQHQDRMGNGYQNYQHQDRMGSGYQNYQHQDRMGNGQQKPQPLLNQPQGAMGRVHNAKAYDMPKPPHLKNNQPGEVESPQPPDPNQLPSPSGLCMNQFTSSSGRMASWHRNQQDNVVEVYSADEIPCAVHGSFYSHWNDILKNGINRAQGRKGIPCYPYVPQGMTGSKAYQLFIFLDVKSALDDGMRFYKLGEKQLFCSGDRQGCIYSKYFKKVVDKETNRIIYPSRPAVGIEAIPGKQYGNFTNNDQRQVSYGRGKAMASQQPKGMQLYQNIWSQVQGVDQDRVDLRPAQSQMLSKMLNISNSPHGFGVNQQSNIQPTTVCNAGTGRKEVSVEDIFRGATNTNHMQRGQQNPNIISMLNAAHNVTNQETQNRRGESPVKSAFVPTQVIRNQTPRKPRQELPKQITEGTVSVEPSNDQKSEKSHVVSLPQTPVPQIENLQQHRVPASKPKRQVRNRLAVNFSHLPSEDTTSQRDNQ